MKFHSDGIAMVLIFSHPSCSVLVDFLKPKPITFHLWELFLYFFFQNIPLFFFHCFLLSGIFVINFLDRCHFFSFLLFIVPPAGFFIFTIISLISKIFNIQALCFVSQMFLFQLFDSYFTDVIDSFISFRILKIISFFMHYFFWVIFFCLYFELLCYLH